MDDQELTSHNQNIKDNLRQIVDIGVAGHDRNLEGKALYMKALITMEEEDVGNAFRAFRAIPNKAGQLDCMDWMVKHCNMYNTTSCDKVIRGMQNLFSVLEILVSRENSKAKNTILNHYGLFLTLDGTGNYRIFRNHRPPALEMITGIPTQDKSPRVLVSAKDAENGVCQHLLKKGKDWFDRIKKALELRRVRYAPCAKYQMDKCYDEDCRYSHKPQVLLTFEKLLLEDMRIIELDLHVQQGVFCILKGLDKRIKELAVAFLPLANENPLSKFASCEQLIKDLFPVGFHPYKVSATSENGRKIHDLLTQTILSVPMKKQMKLYLKARQHHLGERSLSGGYKNLADHNADFFLKHLVLNYFLKLQEKDSLVLMEEFEVWVNQEYGKKHHNGKEMKALLKEKGFLCDIGKDSQCHIICTTHRMYDAISHLAWRNNPSESLIKFTKFVINFKYCSHLNALPELHHLLFWMEFYTTVGMCISAKEHRQTMFLPASYVSSVNLVDNMNFNQDSLRTFEAIQRLPQHKEIVLRFKEGKPEYRVDQMMDIVCSGKVNLIKHILQREDISKMNCSLAERLLVLCLTFVCNMGLTLWPTCEANILHRLCQIKNLPKKECPRLAEAFTAVKDARKPSDLGNVLKNLLQERNDEPLLICEWEANKNYNRYGISSAQLNRVESSMRTRFNHEDTLDAILDPQTTAQKFEATDAAREVEVDEEMSMEEKMKYQRQEQRISEVDKKDKSANIIKRYVQYAGMMQRMSNLTAHVQEEIFRERESVFSHIQINEDRCDVCGVDYNILLANDQHMNPFASLFSSSDTVASSSAVPFPGQNGDQLQVPQQTIYDEEFPVHNGTQQLPGSHGDYESHMQKIKIEKLQLLRQTHEEGIDHYNKKVSFVKLKKIYTENICEVVDRASNVVSRYKLSTERGVRMFHGMSLEIQRLLESLERIQKELAYTLMLGSCNWSDYGGLLEVKSDMSHILDKLLPYIKKIVS